MASTPEGAKPDTTKKPAAPPQAAGVAVPDWERIELDYRAGIKTLRQIAEEHGITHVAVNKRAKRDGWTRDLSAKIQNKAEELVTKTLVTSPVTKIAAATERQVIDASHIRATIHPACHVYKMVPEDVIYDDTVLDGNRVAVSTGIMQSLGTQVIDYKTWYDCCGFGFRHIISEREFTRSFAIDRKLRVVQDEAHADVMIGHDTGCITTLDKNQWISKAGDRPVDVPVLADCQFAALVCGAHPYKIVQSHWHASSTEKLMEKLGIDWQAKKAEFEAYLKEVAAGKIETLYDPRRMITSGPGFKRISATP